MGRAANWHARRQSQACDQAGAGAVLTAWQATPSINAGACRRQRSKARGQRGLKAQPGVVEHTVRVERAGTKDTVLKVHFIQSQNLLGKPGFPALNQACRDLGYGPPVSKFHDSAYR